MELKNCRSNNFTGKELPTIADKQDATAEKINNIDNNVKRLPNTEVMRRSIALIIAVILVVGILSHVTGPIIPEAGRQNPEITYPFQMEKEFYFPDKQFLKAYQLFQDRKYDEAYSSIEPTMANFLAAVEGVDGGFARLDSAGADKCMFFSLICNYVGRAREATQFLEICYIYYRNLAAGSPSEENKDSFFTVILWLAQNYMYMSDYEESARLLNEALDISGMSLADAKLSRYKREINNTLAVLYNNTGEWEKALIALVNNIFSYTEKYSAVTLPEDAEIKILTMPYSEIPLIDFLTGLPEFTINDNEYGYWNDIEDSMASLVPPEYFEMVNSSIPMSEQASMFRNAKIYSLIFSFLKLREDLSDNEKTDAAAAYSNLAIIIMARFGTASNSAMYTGQAIRILDTVKPTTGRDDSIAMVHAVASTSLFQLVSAGAAEFAGPSLLDLGVNYYYTAANLLEEMLRERTNDVILQNYLASLYLNTGLILQSIDTAYKEAGLFMFARAYKLYSGSQNPGAERALREYNNLYRDLHPVKSIFGGGKMFLNKINAEPETIKIL